MFSTLRRRRGMTLIGASLLMLTLLTASVARASNNVSQAYMQQLVAPIALYPDRIVEQVLLASQYPLEVVKAQRWQQQNAQLEAQDALQVAQLEGWPPSVAALVAFPELLYQMSFDLRWTEALGHVVREDYASVLAQVQALRQQAGDAGHLSELTHMRVSHRRQAVVIEPLRVQVIILPRYDAARIYGRWRWPNHPPHNWWRRGHHHREFLSWGAQIVVGDALPQAGLRWQTARPDWGEDIFPRSSFQRRLPVGPPQHIQGIDHIPNIAPQRRNSADRRVYSTQRKPHQRTSTNKRTGQEKQRTRGRIEFSTQ